MPLRLAGHLSLCTVLALLVLLPGAGPAAELHFGVVNERGDRPDLALSQYAALHAYLERRLAVRGIRLGRLVIAQDVAQMIDRLQSGQVDAIAEGVIPTLRMEQKTGVLSPELVVWRKGQREYRTVFFVRRDSPVQTLADLAGRTVAFEAPRSTSAYFVPLATLVEQGLEVRPKQETPAPKAVRYVFAGSELNQAYWVHQGRAEAGAFNDGDWERVPPQVRDELRIVATSRPLLRWLFSVRRDLASETRAALLEELTHAHETPSGREALRTAENIARFEPLTAADREDIDRWRGVLDQLQAGP